MQSRLKVLAVASVLAISACTGYTVGMDQPHMQNALGDLQNANSELAVAAADKGGHREAAMNLINQAIVQVQQGIAYAGG
ncbi:MAG TPA: hypothetical protein VN814_14270 [Caulobacteraceae bacterium]|nr:hypothetical protein [Caulobacteraceae bacterium]